MARLGETDPRWIVAERADGVNVNQWHWDQKDLTNVCEKRLKELFVNRPLVEASNILIESQSLSDFKGDVTVANRKGKRRCFFELSFSLQFEARPCNAEGFLIPFGGKFTVVDCDTQNYIEEFEIALTSEEKGLNDQEAAMRLCRSEARSAIRNIVRNFIEAELMASNGCDSAPMQVKSQSTFVSQAAPAVATNSKADTKANELSSSALDIVFEKKWRASLEDIWDCFVKEDKVSCYTRSSCTMKARVCGDFSFLSGTIKGTFVEFVEKKRIVMKWRLSSWSIEEGANSLVTVDLSECDGGVLMKVVHTGVPSGDIDRVRQGWETNFWLGMEKILGYQYL